jgi:hypothetical protein
MKSVISSLPSLATLDLTVAAIDTLDMFPVHNTSIHELKIYSIGIHLLEPRELMHLHALKRLSTFECSGLFDEPRELEKRTTYLTPHMMPHLDSVSCGLAVNTSPELF